MEHEEQKLPPCPRCGEQLVFESKGAGDREGEQCGICDRFFCPQHIDWSIMAHIAEMFSCDATTGICEICSPQIRAMKGEGNIAVFLRMHGYPIPVDSARWTIEECKSFFDNVLGIDPKTLGIPDDLWKWREEVMKRDK